MAEPLVQLIIDVDDKASGQLHKFADSAVKAFDRVETHATAAATKIVANMSRIGAGFTLASGNLASSANHLIQQVSNATSGVATQFGKLGQQINAAINPALQQFQKNSAQTHQAVQQHMKNTVSTGNVFANGIVGTFQKATAVSVTFLAVNKSLQLVGDAFRFVSTNLVDFDLALREVASISPEVRADFDGIRQQIIAMDPALGTTTELAKGLYETFSAGISINRTAAEALEFTATSAKLAKAGMTDTSTAVKTLSASLSAFGQDITQANKYSDILFQSVVDGSFRFEELANSIGPVLPLASQLGLSFNEVNAILSTLSQGGFSASEAATALRSALTNLVQHGEDFRRIGIDVASTLNGPEGIVGLLKQMAEATGNQVNAVRKLIPDQRGFNAVIALGGNQLQAFIENLKRSEQATGSVNTAVGEINKSISQTFKTLAANAERLVQEVFGPLTPAIVNFGKGLDELVTVTRNRFKDLQTGAQILFGAFDTAFSKVLAVFSDVSAHMEQGLARISRAIADFAGRIPIVGKVLHDALMLQAKGWDEAAERSRLASKSYNEHAAVAAKTTAEMVNQAGASTTLSEKTAKNTAAVVELTGAAAGLSDELDDTSAGLTSVGTAGEHAASGTRSAGKGAGDATAKFLELQRTAQSLSHEVGLLTTQFVNKSKVAKENRAELSAVAEQFTQSVLKSRELSNELVELGANEKFLTGELSGLNEKMLENLTLSGKTVAELQDMRDQYLEANKVIAQTSVTLKDAGINTDTFSRGISNIAGVVEKSQEKLVSFDSRINVLTGTSLTKLREQARATMTNVVESMERGDVKASILRETVQKIIDKFDKLGVEAPADMLQVENALVNLDTRTRSVADSFERLTGIKLDNVSQEVVDVETDMRNMIESGLIGAEELNRIFVEKTGNIVRVLGDLPPSLKAVQNDILAMKPAFTSVEEAARKYGFESKAVLQQAAQDALAAFNTMKNSGQFTTEQLRDFFVHNVLEQWQAAGLQAQANFEGVLREMNRAARMEFDATAMSAEDMARRMGFALKTDAVEGAQEAHNKIANLANQGVVSFRQLAEAYDHMVIKGFIETGQKIPPEFERMLTRLKDLARVEGERVGNTLGDSIANAAGPKIDLIEGRFKKVLHDLNNPDFQLPPTFTKFEDDINGLMKQLQDTENRRGNFHSGYKMFDELNAKAAEEQIDIMKKKLREMVFDAVTLNDKMGLPDARIPDNVISAMHKLGLTLAQVRNYTGTSNKPEAPVSTGAPTQTTPSRSTGASIPRFQNGSVFTQQGQVASLEAGEAILTRDTAAMLRNALIGPSFGAGAARSSMPSVASGSVFTPSSGGVAPNSMSGFQFVPGIGYVPTMRLAAATGRLEENLGPNAQREIQRTVTPIIRGSITRRDLTRAITSNTSLTRKGAPTIGKA